jgi:hypothetical protein
MPMHFVNCLKKLAVNGPIQQVVWSGLMALSLERKAILLVQAKHVTNTIWVLLLQIPALIHPQVTILCTVNMPQALHLVHKLQQILFVLCSPAGAASCVDWYNAAEPGTPGSTSGASQACYEYHLTAAMGDSTADPSTGNYSMHCDHASGAAPCQ